MRRRPTNRRGLGQAEAALAPSAPDAAVRLDWTDWLPRNNSALLRVSFGAFAAIADIVVIVASATLAGIGYHLFAYGWAGPAEIFVQLGVSVAIVFVVANTMRDEYLLSNYLEFAGHGRRTFMLWNLVTVCALAIGFMTKTTAEISRATTVLFYLGGLCALLASRAAIVRAVRHSASAGAISLRRVFLVGSEADVEGFASRYQPWESGMHVVAAAVLRGRETLADDLALAAASARMLRPDDVFILAPWSESETIDACIRQAGIRRVLTSRRVLERFPLTLNAELLFLEDLREKATAVDKLAAAVQGLALP